MNTAARQAKISRLKEQINQGLYRVDARSVAKAILLSERWNHRLVPVTGAVHVQRRLVERRSPPYSRHGRSERRLRVAAPLQERKLVLCRTGEARALLC
ncbi:MAG: flagellar biosynthesis anti-sigma factor FlgM [Deltaproteobacteria bacterium]|nr:flagellar biosynthesis anti-sigma factor FlgM [Deltaproteobacteria bacterium]